MRQKLLLMIIAVVMAASVNAVFAQAAHDTLTIYDLQHVTGDSLINDLQPHLGDTVVFKAQMMTTPRELWIGARWSAYVVDPVRHVYSRRIGHGFRSLTSVADIDHEHRSLCTF